MSGPNPIIYYYKGEEQDFLLLVESSDIVKKYLKDSTIPLSDVISGPFKIYTTQTGRGSEGVLETASKQQLETEFGKAKVEEIIKLILQKGENRHEIKSLKSETFGFTK